jgi:hypothetical protein
MTVILKIAKKQPFNRLGVAAECAVYQSAQVAGAVVQVWVFFLLLKPINNSYSI